MIYLFLFLLFFLRSEILGKYDAMVFYQQDKFLCLFGGKGLYYSSSGKFSSIYSFLYLYFFNHLLHSSPPSIFFFSLFLSPLSHSYSQFFFLEYIYLTGYSDIMHATAVISPFLSPFSLPPLLTSLFVSFSFFFFFFSLFLSFHTLRNKFDWALF